MYARDPQQHAVETHTSPSNTANQTSGSTDLAINTSDSSVYQLSCD